MSGSAADMLAAARNLLVQRNAPINANNLNSAMLALAQNRDVSPDTLNNVEDVIDQRSTQRAPARATQQASARAARPASEPRVNIRAGMPDDAGIPAGVGTPTAEPTNAGPSTAALVGSRLGLRLPGAVDVDGAVTGVPTAVVAPAAVGARDDGGATVRRGSINQRPVIDEANPTAGMHSAPAVGRQAQDVDDPIGLAMALGAPFTALIGGGPAMLPGMRVGLARGTNQLAGPGGQAAIAGPAEAAAARGAAASRAAPAAIESPSAAGTFRAPPPRPAVDVMQPQIGGPAMSPAAAVEAAAALAGTPAAAALAAPAARLAAPAARTISNLPRANPPDVITQGGGPMASRSALERFLRSMRADRGAAQ